MITIFAVIELSARNEEEPVSGHSVVVYADEERNSSNHFHTLLQPCVQL